MSIGASLDGPSLIESATTTGDPIMDAANAIHLDPPNEDSCGKPRVMVCDVFL
ncbi:MAG: hypothetical protein JWO16_966, partial [Sphingomonas bacterium]|nr:hypothetical protein [Sphingomonas bacterium]